MVKENKHGKMGHVIKDNGVTIKLQEKGNLSMFMGTATKGNGKTTKLMDTVYMFIKKRMRSMRVFGKMICSTGLE